MGFNVGLEILWKDILKSKQKKNYYEWRKYLSYIIFGALNLNKKKTSKQRFDLKEELLEGRNTIFVIPCVVYI